MGALLALIGALCIRSEEKKQHQPAPLRVLFLSTENSTRSQMAEVLLRALSHGTIEAYSAGSAPASAVHPLAIRVMERLACESTRAVPKHFEEFRGQHFDAVITLCDRDQEVCPVFPEDHEGIHWHFPRPTHRTGSEEVRYRAFDQLSLQLAMRIRLLITLLERERTQQ